MPFRTFLLVALLAAAACTASPSAPPGGDASASATPSSDVSAAAEASATPNPTGQTAPDAHISSTDASPEPVFVTPVPLLDRAPGIPIGRAASAQGPAPAAGMVRLSGLVLASKSPAPGICVTLGPPIACAVLTDPNGQWVIDVPQGKITWEFHFIHEGREVGPKVVIDGPFGRNSVSVETVSLGE